MFTDLSNYLWFIIIKLFIAIREVYNFKMERFNSEQSASMPQPEISPQPMMHKFSDFEGGSVIKDASVIDSMQRLMQSEQTQSPEQCSNTNWQHLEMLIATLQEIPEDQIDEIFTMQTDPKQGQKIVLTETQFNLVRKVYTKCFIGSKFSLQDDKQLVTQFFLNLRAMKMRILKQ